MQIQTWLEHTTRIFRAAAIDSARIDALVLLENVLHQPRSWLVAHGDEHLTETQKQLADTLAEKRTSRIPLAYIIGVKEFYGREFLVNSDVLIPRPESEALIELLLTKKSFAKTAVILDVGTGSGCLAVTAQLELPTATVLATDTSKQALQVAKKNATLLKAPVQFYEANLLDLPPAIKPDFIMANLPYVPEQLITSAEITHEPAAALFSGKDGLDHYQLFWKQIGARESSRPEFIITECLESQQTAMITLARQAGYRHHTTTALALLFERT